MEKRTTLVIVLIVLISLFAGSFIGAVIVVMGNQNQVLDLKQVVSQEIFEVYDSMYAKNIGKVLLVADKYISDKEYGAYEYRIDILNKYRAGNFEEIKSRKRDHFCFLLCDLIIKIKKSDQGENVPNELIDDMYLVYSIGIELLGLEYEINNSFGHGETKLSELSRKLYYYRYVKLPELEQKFQRAFDQLK